MDLRYRDLFGTEREGFSNIKLPSIDDKTVALGKKVKKLVEISNSNKFKVKMRNYAGE